MRAGGGEPFLRLVLEVDISVKDILFYVNNELFKLRRARNEGNNEYKGQI